MHHWLIFAVVASLLFHDPIVSLFRSLGRSLLELKNGMREPEDDFNPPDFVARTSSTDIVRAFLIVTTVVGTLLTVLIWLSRLSA